MFWVEKQGKGGYFETPHAIGQPGICLPRRLCSEFPEPVRKVDVPWVQVWIQLPCMGNCGPVGLPMCKEN